MPEITIYSRLTCAPCTAVKKWLMSKGLTYTEKRIDDNPDYAREAYEKSGAAIVPVITVGDQIITGMNFGLLTKYLTPNQ